MDVITKPVCDVYVAPFCPLDEYPEVFPPERDREIRECRNPGLKAAKFADWTLLSLALRRSLGVDPESVLFEKTGCGRWCTEGFDFSLSHAADVVAVAVSTGAVGVDVEAVERFEKKRTADRTGKIRARFFTENELRKYPEGTIPFLACWTGKEAAFKKGGSGGFDPASVDAALSGAVSFLLGEDRGAVLSVCAEHVGDVRVLTVKNGEVIPADIERVVL